VIAAAGEAIAAAGEAIAAAGEAIDAAEALDEPKPFEDSSPYGATLPFCISRH
jgi:hypothetical protein